MAQQAPTKRLPLSRHHLSKKAGMVASPATKLEASLPTPPTSPKLWVPTAPAQLPSVTEEPPTPLTPQSNDGSTPCSCRIILSTPTKRLPYSRTHLAKRAEKIASQDTKLEVSTAAPPPVPGLWTPATTKPALWSAPTTTTSTRAFKPRAQYTGTPTFSGSCEFTTPNYYVRTQLPASPPLSPCSLPSGNSSTSSTIEYISIATPSSNSTALVATPSTSRSRSSCDDGYQVWPVDAPFSAPITEYDSPALDTEGIFSQPVGAMDLSRRLNVLLLKELGKWRMEGESIVRIEREMNLGLRRSRAGEMRRMEKEEEREVVVGVSETAESL